jgi:hypothetical protein
MDTVPKTEVLYSDMETWKDPKILYTIEITTRCGQDSDCNPSNAMAVLGVIKGFKGLPKAFVFSSTLTNSTSFDVYR